MNGNLSGSPHQHGTHEDGFMGLTVGDWEKWAIQLDLSFLPLDGKIR